jgi:hypothetical protein
MATLQIELEDMAGTSRWASVLATLASQSGNAYLRFVGRVDGHRHYKGATISAPRTLGTLPPQEAWAPGMTKSLQDLRREIEHDGWVEARPGYRALGVQVRTLRIRLVLQPVRPEIRR